MTNQEKLLHQALGENQDKQWYELFPQRWKEESLLMELKHPQLRLSYDENKNTQWIGSIAVNDINGQVYIPDTVPYKHIEIIIRAERKFPLSFPAVIDAKKILKPYGFPHVNVNDSSLCYAFRYSTGLDFVNKSRIADVVFVIQEFMLKCFCYEHIGTWPGGEELHGLEAFISWEIRNGPVDPNDICPCPKGKLFKICHQKELEAFIRWINPMLLGLDSENKISRNDQCLCGRPIKYKYCELQDAHKEMERVYRLPDSHKVEFSLHDVLVLYKRYISKNSMYTTN